MYRTFLLRWATLDLHQKKKHKMRKHWNYWMHVFPASKRHIWKALEFRQARLEESDTADLFVTRLFQLVENCDIHKSKNIIFAGSSSHFRRPLRDIAWSMKCAESRGRSQLKLIHEEETSIPRSRKLFIRLKVEVEVVFVVDSKAILQKIQRTRQVLLFAWNAYFANLLKQKKRISIDSREGINEDDDFAFTLQTSGRDIPSIDLELYSSTSRCCWHSSSTCNIIDRET